LREFLKRGVLFSAAVVCIPLVTAPYAAPVQPTKVEESDPRLQKLRTFFSRFDCPALEYAHVFLEASDRHSLDWRLLPGISYVESTSGKAAKGNNLFGWDSGRARFASPTASIHKVAFRLSAAPKYRGKTVDQKLSLYNSREGYARKVRAVMRQIDGIQ
jgi:hypothetical protein